MRKRVLLGMSGGTDSSVAAILLQQQGFEVIGLTLRTWSEKDTGKAEPEYIVKARTLADKIGIEHHTADIRNEFYNKIISYFKNEYANGRTPHPCAKCNPEIKWETMAEYADKLDCNLLATGHYNGVSTFKGLHYITVGRDADKEQSFFLWGLKQDILSRAIFPLAGLTKTEVRQIAVEQGFAQIAGQKESIGICFLDKKDYRPFLSQLLKNDGIDTMPGYFTDKNGNIIGRHNGIPFYTVGQRRGLGLTPSEPLYVNKIDTETNNITLSDLTGLYKTTFKADDYNVVNKSDFDTPVDIRVRYRKQNARGIVLFDTDKTLTVNLIEPEWGIAPGQAVAFYRNNILLGGGFIR